MLFMSGARGIITDRADLIEDLVSRLRAGAQVELRSSCPPATHSTAATVPRTGENFQPDGYGSWLWALEQHLGVMAATSRLPARGELDGRISAPVWSQPCYDWWEEHPDHKHVSTLGAIAAGLRRGRCGCGFLIAEIATDAQAAARDIRERFDAMACTRVTQ